MKQYDRREHHPNRRVDRASHESREHMLDMELAPEVIPLDDMLESGEVHSNIYGERVEGYPGQGEAEYDDYDTNDYRHRSNIENQPRGLM